MLAEPSSLRGVECIPLGIVILLSVLCMPGEPSGLRKPSPACELQI